MADVKFERNSQIPERSQPLHYTGFYCLSDMVGRFPGFECLNESFLTMIYARLSHQSSNGIEKVLLTELAFLSQSKIMNLPVIFPMISYVSGIR